MKTPANLCAFSHPDNIVLRWEKSSLKYPYEIIRYTGHAENYSEIHRLVVSSEDLESQGDYLVFKDTRSIKRGEVYFFSVQQLTPGHQVGNQKLVRVAVDIPLPTPVKNVYLTSLSRGRLAVDWSDYKETDNIKEFHLFVEPKPFHSIAGKSPKLILNSQSRSCVYEIIEATPALHVAVIPVSINGRKAITAFPSVINDPWRSVIHRDPAITFSILPIAQYESLEIVIDLVDGVPDSEYAIIIGSGISPDTLITDSSGIGRARVEVPQGIGPGRHTISLDNGEGSYVSSENILLIPVRLSPTANDFIEPSETSIIEGFDNTVIDRIKFWSTTTDSDTVAFRFRDGMDPESLRLEICNLLALIHTGGITTSSGPISVQVNVPVRVLPSFTYPSFMHNISAGSLNLLGLVQETRFQTIQDWADHINDFHEYYGGMSKVVRSITEIKNDSFGSSLIDIGLNYEGNFAITPGSSYLIEVKEPVTNYCISADGYVTFDYLPMIASIQGSMNSLVLVADGNISDSETWATEINNQHELGGGIPRVVLSIRPWSSENQVFSDALVDTGTRYEGNFPLIAGKGYVVEVKEVVDNFILTGNAWPTGVC